MNDSMIGGGSATHDATGLDANAVASSLKSQFEALRKILSSNLSMSKKLKEIEKLESKITKQKWSQVNATRALKNITEQLKNSQKIEQIRLRIGQEAAGNLIATSKVSTRIFRQNLQILKITKNWSGTLGTVLSRYQSIEARLQRINRLQGYATGVPIVSPVAAEPRAQERSAKSQNQAVQNIVAGSPRNHWLASIGQQARYWGQLRLLYGLYNRVTEGGRTFLDLENEISLAMRTAVSDLSDETEVLKARNEIINAATDYLSKHIGAVKEYGQAVNALTQAEMPRKQALEIAPVIMAAAKGLDAPIDEMSRLLVGLNELFGKSFKGMTSDVERFEHMASVMALAVKKQVVTIPQMLKGLQYSGALAKSANLSFEELVASISVLNTNLLAGSKAGTSMRRIIGAIGKNWKKLNKEFALGIDPTKTMNFTEIIARLSDKIKAGSLNVEKLNAFLSSFGLRGGPGALTLANAFESMARTTRILKNAKLDDLLGMRDVVEGTTAAQLGILNQNLNLLMGSFLRGAVGGDSLAKSLQNLNSKFLPLHHSATLFGETIKTVFGNKWRMGMIATGLILSSLHRKFTALAAAQNSSYLSAMKLWGRGAAPMLGITLAIGLISRLVYAHEQRKLALENEIKTSKRAQASYEKEARRISELIDALDSSTGAKNKLSALNKRLEELAKLTGKSFDRQVKSIAAARAELIKYHLELQNAAKSEALKIINKIIDTNSQTSFFDENAPAWFKSFTEGTKTLAMKITPVIDSDVANLDKLRNQLDTIKEQGKKAGLSESEITDLANRAAAPTLARIEAARKLIDDTLKQKSGYSLSPTTAPVYRKILTDLESATDSIQNKIKNLFIITKIESKKASINTELFKAKLEALRKEFDKMPELSFSEKLSALNKKGLSTFERGAAKAALYADEIKRLDEEMKNLKEAAKTDYIPKTEANQKEVTKSIEKNLADFRKAQKEKMKLESELLQIRKHNEDIIAKQQEKTLREHEASIKKIQALVDKYKSKSTSGQLWRDSMKEAANLITGYTKKDASGKEFFVKPTRARREFAVGSLKANLIDQYLSRATRVSGYTAAMRAVAAKFGKDKVMSDSMRKALFTGVDPYYSAQIKSLRGKKVVRNKYGDVVFNPQDEIRKLLEERKNLLNTISSLSNKQIYRLKKNGAIGIVSSLRGSEAQKYAMERLQKIGLETPLQKWTNSANLLTGALNRLTETINIRNNIITGAAAGAANWKNFLSPRMKTYFPEYVPKAIPPEISDVKIKRQTNALQRAAGETRIVIQMNEAELNNFIAKSGETHKITVELAKDAAEKANELIDSAKAHAQRIRQYMS